VRLRAGEVEQCRTEAAGRHDPRSTWTPSRVTTEVLVSPEPSVRSIPSRARNAACDRRRVVGGDQDVDVADVLTEAAQAPGVGDLDHPVDLAELRDEALGQRQRGADRDAAVLRGQAELLDAVAQVVDRLGTHARQLGERPSSRPATSAATVGCRAASSSSCTVFGPSPGTCSSATCSGGCAARSSSSLPIVPVSTYSRMRAAMLLPMPLTLASSLALSVPTSWLRAPDRPFGVLVGAHPEGVGAALVQLGQDRELGQQPRHLVVGPRHLLVLRLALGHPGPPSCRAADRGYSGPRSRPHRTTVGGSRGTGPLELGGHRRGGGPVDAVAPVDRLLRIEPRRHLGVQGRVEIARARRDRDRRGRPPATRRA
jgi:hypothetical protein